MRLLWSPGPSWGLPSACLVFVCVLGLPRVEAASAPCPAAASVSGDVRSADGSTPACERVELWAIPETGEWQPLGPQAWGAVTVELPAGTWRVAAHGCGTYFPFLPSAPIRCRTDASGCVGCSGSFSIKMYAMFGSFRGRVIRLPEGGAAGEGIPVSAAAAGCAADRYAATDGRGIYALETTLEPHRSNHWSLLLDGDGSGPGSKTYLLSADTCDNAVEATTFSSAQIAVDLYQMAPYMASAEPSMRLPPFPPALQHAPPSDVGLGVNPTTGNLALDHVDVRGGDPDGLLFTRSYNSRSPAAGSLGPGWTHAYEAQLTAPSAGVLMLQRGDGGYVYFEDMDGDRTYRPSVPVWEGSVVVKAASGYTRKRPDGGAEVYDVGGRLVAMASPSGRKTLIARGSSGRITSITDPEGRKLLLQHRADGRLTKVATPSSLMAGYEYDSEGRLGTVTYPDGTGYRFSYDAGGLGRMTDLTGRVLRRCRYAAGRVASVEIADGQERRTFRYQPLAATVTDAGGAVTEVRWVNKRGVRSVTTVNGPCPACDVERPAWDPKPPWPGAEWLLRFLPAVPGPWTAAPARGDERIQESRAWTYDGEGRVLTYRDGTAASTRYTYDSLGRIVTVTDPLDRVTRYEYDTASRLVAAIRPSRVAPDSRRSVRWTHDAAGRITSRTETGLLTGGEPFSRTTQFAYDGAGRLSAADGPRSDASDTVTFSYHPSGGLATIAVSPEVFIQVRAYDDLGHPGSVTTPARHVVPHTFDTRGRVVSRGAPGQRTFYEYSPSGRLLRVTRPRGHDWTYTYDVFDRLVSVRDGSGRTRGFRYDVMGRVEEERLQDAAGKTERRWRRERDGYGRVFRVVASDGLTSERTFDPAGRVTGFRPAALSAESTAYTYDAAGRLVLVQPPGALPVQYRYDAGDGLVSAVTGGRTLSFSHDDTGALVRQSSPEVGTIRFAYDTSGALRRETRTDGTFVAYERDGLGRMIRVFYPKDRATVFQYDNCPAGAGQLCEVSDATGTTRFEYDGQGRLSREERSLGDAQFTTEYDYDVNDNVTTVRYPTGRTITFRRNSADEVQAVASGAAVLVEGATYSPEGALTGLLSGNGVGLLAAHDSAGRLTGLRVGRTIHQSVTYDDLGPGPSAINDVLDAGRNLTYTYADGRLVGATGPWGTSTWSYEPTVGRVGDTAPEGGTSLAHEAGTQRLAAVSGRLSLNYTHDANGRVVTAGSRRYAYDDAGRLIGVTDAKGSLARYAYDHRGRRAWKAEADATTLFHYDSADRLIAETTRDGKPLAEYVYLGALPVAVYRPSGLSYLHPDLLGAPALATDGQGRRVWDAGAGRPFGDDAATAVKDRVAIRGPGEYLDVETGLVQNRGRHLDPRLGRYLEPLPPCDTLGLGEGSNAYAYAFNRPVGLSAPDGRHVMPAGSAWGASTAAVRLSPPDLPAVEGGACGRASRWAGPRPGPGLWEWADPTAAFDLAPAGDRVQSTE